MKLISKNCICFICKVFEYFVCTQVSYARFLKISFAYKFHMQYFVCKNRTSETRFYLRKVLGKYACFVYFFFCITHLIIKFNIVFFSNNFIMNTSAFFFHHLKDLFQVSAFRFTWAMFHDTELN